jgi:hypothetical protein
MAPIEEILRRECQQRRRHRRGKPRRAGHAPTPLNDKRLRDAKSKNEFILQNIFFGPWEPVLPSFYCVRNIAAF